MTKKARRKAAARKPIRIGYNDEWNRKMAGLAARGGATWARGPMSDVARAKLASKGVRSWNVLSHPMPGETPAQYRARAAAYAAHYKGPIEVMNEPQSTYAKSMGTNLGAKKYATYLRAAVHGVQSVNPNRRVISGGLAPGPQRKASSWAGYLRRVANLTPHLNYEVGLHPYVNATTRKGAKHQVLHDLLVAKRAAPGRQVDYTELGFSSAGGAHQAQMLKAAITASHRHGVNDFIVHSLLPESAVPGWEAYSTYGKPAYKTLKRLAKSSATGM